MKRGRGSGIRRNIHSDIYVLQFVIPGLNRNPEKSLNLTPDAYLKE